MTPAAANWFAVYRDSDTMVAYRRVVAWIEVEDRHTEVVGLVTSSTTPAVVKANTYTGLITYRHITDETILQAINVLEVEGLERAKGNKKRRVTA